MPFQYITSCVIYPSAYLLFYLFYVQPAFAYFGFAHLSTYDSVFFLSCAFILSSLSYLDLRNRAWSPKPSDLLLIVFLQSSAFGLLLQLSAQNKLYAVYISLLFISSFYLSSRIIIPLAVDRSFSAFVLGFRPLLKYLPFLLLLSIPLIINNISLSGFDLSADSSALIYTKESLYTRSHIFNSFPFANYFILSFRYLLGPVLILSSLKSRKYLLSLFSFFVYFVLSTNASSKIDLVLPLIVFFFYYVARFINIISFPFSLSLFLSFLLGFSFLLLELSPFQGINRIVVGLFMRSLYVQGIVAMNYREFFTENHLIYLTHVGFLNSFYPYSDILPKVMRSNFVGGNQNSHFLSVEGFASFGVLFGPLVSFALASIILSFVNYQLANFRLCQYSLCILLPIALAFCDQPLSTSILSGGLLGYTLLAPIFPYSFGLIPKTSAN